MIPPRPGHSMLWAAEELLRIGYEAALLHMERVQRGEAHPPPERPAARPPAARPNLRVVPRDAT